MEYKVVEIFQSINGEGMKAGELSVFVRMQGCNLSCEYCDTSWANTADAIYQSMTAKDIISRVKEERVKNVTLTGGEPLLQPNISELLLGLAKAGFVVEIETNGSVSLKEFVNLSSQISFTMDYKLAGSKMEQKMDVSNFSLLRKKDTVKFVVSDREDLERAYEVTRKYLAEGQCNILLSPVFGKIEPEEMVEFMKEKHWTKARLQLQMHKIIWDPQKRGV